MITRQLKNPVLLLGFMLTPLINIGLDLYTPSLPAIAHTFHASHNAVKLTLFIYAAVFGVAQIITGPLSDRTGRKLYVWLALIIFTIASLGAPFSPNMLTLYVFRVGQAIGAAIFCAVMKAMLVDSFTGKQLAKANSFYSMSWSLTPIVAPVIGGYLQHYFNWQANFYFMGLYGVMGLIACYFLLYETLPKHKIAHTHLPWLHAWKMLLSDKIFITGSILLSIQFIILILYYTVAPFVIQTQLHYSASFYGKVMLFIGLTYFMGNIVNGWLLNFLSLHKIILWGLICSLLTCLVMTYFNHRFGLTIITITLPIYILFFFDGLIFANVLTLSTSRHRQYAGTSGALLGGILNLITALISTGCTYFWHLHDLHTLCMVYVILFLFALTLFLLFFQDINTQKTSA